MGLKSLLVVTAVAEGGTGLILLWFPSVVFSLLLGVRPASPEALLVGRIAGAALLGIGVASGSASRDKGSRAQLSLLAGILVYNVAAAMLLGYAGTVSGPVGIALWPAVVFHLGLAAWCIWALLRCRRRPDSPSDAREMAS